MVYNTYQLLFFFVIYAFFGWCLEVVYQAVQHGKFINRGFLNGPYCPIYGFGVITVTLALYPIKENIIILYAGSAALASALELVTGFVLEKIFHQHWWDYSGERFNVKGYICLKFSLLWGVACLVTVRLIHPPIEKFVDMIPHTAGVVILIILYIGFVSDLIITIMAIMHIKKRIKLLEGISAEMRRISDRTGERLFDGVEAIRDKSGELSEKNAALRQRAEELRERYKELSDKRYPIGKRLEKAFPRLNLLEQKSLKTQIDELIARISKKNDK